MNEKVVLLKSTLRLSSQGLLSVTEELHSLSFEAQFTIQGLAIDLEVSYNRASRISWKRVQMQYHFKLPHAASLHI